MTTKQNTAHTPGPWHMSTLVEYNGALYDGWYTIFTTGREVARIHVNDPASTNARLDALLIASAPALLEALEAMMKNPQVAPHIPPADWHTARTVLAQARGRPPYVPLETEAS